jgi:hypothetical protein
MTDEIDPRYQPDQTYPTESGREHPPAPGFPGEAPGQSANVPEVTQAPGAPEQYGNRPQGTAPAGAAAPEHGAASPYSAQDSDRTAPFVESNRSAAQLDDRDTSVRNEKQLVADSHAERPDESLGQRFEWQGGRPGAAGAADQGELRQEARGGRWRKAAVAVAGVGMGAFLLNRRRRRRHD